MSGARPALLPIVLVLGKGGVGKTTVAAALALLGAESSGRGVLVELGDGESGRRALEGSGDAVEHVVLHPSEALQRGAAPLFGSATLARIVLGNFAIRPLLQAAPAIRELALLECVRQVAADRPGARVVVDMPATGHAIAWLRVAAQGRAFLEAGPMFELCDRVVRDVVSPDRASVVVVALPEPLVIEETGELCAAIATQVGLRVDRVVINRMPAAVPPATLRDVLVLAAGSGPAADAARALAGVLRARDASSRQGEASIASLASAVSTLVRLPLAAADPNVRLVARWLFEEGER